MLEGKNNLAFKLNGSKDKNKESIHISAIAKRAKSINKEATVETKRRKEEEANKGAYNRNIRTKARENKKRMIEREKSIEEKTRAAQAEVEKNKRR